VHVVGDESTPSPGATPASAAGGVLEGSASTPKVATKPANLWITRTTRARRTALQSQSHRTKARANGRQDKHQRRQTNGEPTGALHSGGPVSQQMLLG
jgi:hypothetical protein